LAPSTTGGADLVAADRLDFNGFEGGLWEAFDDVSLIALPDFFAAAVPVLATGVLAAAFLALRVVVAAFEPAALPTGVLEDFLRVFLDIRLPFVAFGGSTIGMSSISFRKVGFVPTVR
jgi:hypothetical protein